MRGSVYVLERRQAVRQRFLVPSFGGSSPPAPAFLTAAIYSYFYGSDMAVSQILSNYRHENPGVRANLRRLLNHGALAGTGKLVILPVDQGFEHGPDQSFIDNVAAYDPVFHAQLAVDSGLSAFASSLGVIEAVAHDYAGVIPLILKLNHNNSLSPSGEEPDQNLAALVESAVTLGCSGVGFTIYPGSGNLYSMMDELRHIVHEAKKSGLFVVVWSYPRGADLDKNDETALDVISYGAHIAASLGANIIKVKIPSNYLRNKELGERYKSNGWDINDEATRVSMVMRSCFDGRRMVLFSGGQKKADLSLAQEVVSIKNGGGTGSIIGRNVFQRERSSALKLLSQVIDLYKSA